MDSTNILKFHFDDLLGIIVWLQVAEDVKGEQHAAAVHFFLSRNPQSTEFFQILKTKSKQIQVRIVEIYEPKDKFITSATNAANSQAGKLDPCVLVLQQGLLPYTNLPINHFYVMGSFFAGITSETIIPQSDTKIVLVI